MQFRYDSFRNVAHLRLGATRCKRAKQRWLEVLLPLYLIIRRVHIIVCVLYLLFNSLNDFIVFPYLLQEKGGDHNPTEAGGLRVRRRGGGGGPGGERRKGASQNHRDGFNPELRARMSPWLNKGSECIRASECRTTLQMCNNIWMKVPARSRTKATKGWLRVFFKSVCFKQTFYLGDETSAYFFF